jgi:hypothetical protein
MGALTVITGINNQGMRSTCRYPRVARFVFKSALGGYAGFVSDGTLIWLSTHERICKKLV